MTWIQEYRESIGMTRGEFARAVTEKLGGSGERRVKVPETLIYILEEHPHPYTHPNLINAIAKACGATKAQRDMFIAKQHRNLPFKQTAPAVTAREAHPWRRSPGAATEKAVQSAGERARKCARNCRAVVLINRRGAEVARKDSVQEAAEAMGLSESSVADRCRGYVHVEFGAGNHLTCRYADEWDAMSEERRREMIWAMVERSERQGQITKQRRVVVVDRNGNVRARYEGMRQAAAGELVSSASVQERCRRMIRNEFKHMEVTFRFEEEWEKMTPEERMKDLRTG